MFTQVVVGPVGFEPTTSGPDFSGSPAPQGHRPRLDSGILWAGSIPLTKLDDGPHVGTEPGCFSVLCSALVRQGFVAWIDEIHWGAGMVIFMTVSSTGYPSLLQPSIPSSISLTLKPRAVSFAAALVEALQNTPSQYVT